MFVVFVLYEGRIRDCSGSGCGEVVAVFCGVFCLELLNPMVGGTVLLSKRQIIVEDACENVVRVGMGCMVLQEGVRLKKKQEGEGEGEREGVEYFVSQHLTSFPGPSRGVPSGWPGVGGP